jgi:hypothetical protein
MYKTSSNLLNHATMSPFFVFVLDWTFLFHHTHGHKMEDIHSSR